MTFMMKGRVDEIRGMLAIIQSHLISKNLKFKIYKNVVLPIVLYGCESWSLTSREEHGLRVSENSVLRIFGP
jgi:hypothetical protein